MDDLRDLLGVKWYDGLVVNSDHLHHVDKRIWTLLSKVCESVVDQPGLIAEDIFSSTPHQLVEIDHFAKGQETIDISLKISRPFNAISPDGHIVVGIPNLRTRFGIPEMPLKAALPLAAQKTLCLVCVRQQLKNDLKIETKDDVETPIELNYPALGADIVPVDTYKRELSSSFRDAAVIGAISLVDEEPVVNTRFIPPVVKLEYVRSFDEGLLNGLTIVFNDLYAVSRKLVKAGAELISMDDVGSALLRRRVDYRILSAILMGKLAVMRHLGRLSPFGFFLDVIYPVAEWWKNYCDERLKEPGGPYEIAKRLMKLSHVDFCAGSDDFLYDSRELLRGVCEALGRIA